MWVASPGASNPQEVPIEGDILNWPIVSFNVLDEFKLGLSQEKLVVQRKGGRRLTFSDISL